MEDWVYLYNMSDYCNLCSILGHVVAFVFFLLALFVFFFFAACLLSRGQVTKTWLLGQCRRLTVVSLLKSLVTRKKLWLALLLPLFILNYFVSEMFRLVRDYDQPPQDVVKMKAAVSEGRGQCITGELLSIETGRDGKVLYSYIRIGDETLRMHQLGHGKCYSYIYTHNFISSEIERKLPSSKRQELRVCWIQDLFDKSLMRREDGKCIYEISARAL